MRKRLRAVPEGLVETKKTGGSVLRSSIPECSGFDSECSGFDSKCSGFDAARPSIPNDRQAQKGQTLPTVGRPKKVASSLTHVAGRIGIISDLDQTVIPAHDGPRIPRPFPGIRQLYQELEGGTGPMHYVTARSSAEAEEIPAYLARHRFPQAEKLFTGPKREDDRAKALGKIRDIKRILKEHPNRGFVLFGDSSHVDPFVYRAIRKFYPEQVSAAFIHRVKDNVPSDGYEGLIVIDNYAEAAVALCEKGVISRDAAHRVIDKAIAQGLELGPSELARLRGRLSE